MPALPEALRQQIISMGCEPEEFREERSRSSGPGGQNVNKVETAVAILHIPTGLRVRSEESRSQSRNRERAWELILEKMQENRRQARERIRAEREKKRRSSRPRPQSVKREFQKMKTRRKTIKATRGRVRDC